MELKDFEIYNDGDYRIIEEEIETKDSEYRKYYSVDYKYKLVASFKDKKEALLWVGWLNTRAIKDSNKED